MKKSGRLSPLRSVTAIPRPHRSSGKPVLQDQEVEEAVVIKIEDADVTAAEQRPRAGAAPLGDVHVLAAAFAIQLAALRLRRVLRLPGRRVLQLITRNVQVEVPAVGQVHEDGTAAAAADLHGRGREGYELAALHLAKQPILPIIRLPGAVREIAQE